MDWHNRGFPSGLRVPHLNWEAISIIVNEWNNVNCRIRKTAKLTSFLAVPHKGELELAPIAVEVVAAQKWNQEP